MKRIAQLALCSAVTLGALARSRDLESTTQAYKDQLASGDDLFQLEEDAMIIDTIPVESVEELPQVVPVIEFNEDGDLTVR